MVRSATSLPSDELTELILNERAARFLLREEGSDDQRLGTTRDYWKAVEALFAHLGHRVPNVDCADFADTALFLAQQAGYLGAGVVPDPIRDVAKKGNHSPGPSEQRDVGLAVAYRKACSPEGLPASTF